MKKKKGAWQKLAAKDSMLRDESITFCHTDRLRFDWELKYRFKTGNRVVKENWNTDWAVRRRLCVDQRYCFKDKHNINGQTGVGLWYACVWSLHTHPVSYHLTGTSEEQSRRREKITLERRARLTCSSKRIKSSSTKGENLMPLDCFGFFKHGDVLFFLHCNQFKLHIWTK